MKAAKVNESILVNGKWVCFPKRNNIINYVNMLIKKKCKYGLILNDLETLIT